MALMSFSISQDPVQKSKRMLQVTENPSTLSNHVVSKFFWGEAKCSDDTKIGELLLLHKSYPFSPQIPLPSGYPLRRISK